MVVVKPYAACITLAFLATLAALCRGVPRSAPSRDVVTLADSLHGVAIALVRFSLVI